MAAICEISAGVSGCNRCGTDIASVPVVVWQQTERSMVSPVSWGPLWCKRPAGPVVSFESAAEHGVDLGAARPDPDREAKPDRADQREQAWERIDDARVRTAHQRQVGCHQDQTGAETGGAKRRRDQPVPYTDAVRVLAEENNDGDRHHDLDDEDAEAGEGPHP